MTVSFARAHRLTILDFYIYTRPGPDVTERIERLVSWSGGWMSQHKFTLLFLVSFDCEQLTEHIGQVARIQIPSTMCAVSLENGIYNCLSNLGTDGSSSVFNVDDPISAFRFCHCLSLLCESASQSR